MAEHRLDWQDGEWFYNDTTLKTADELEAARILLDCRWAVRNDRITTYRGKTPCLKVSVGWAADHVVRANKGGTPVFALVTAAKTAPD